MKFSKISVIGLGYIGLPTAAIFASHKILVNGVDIDLKVVNSVNAGKTHIKEPNLDQLVSKAVSKGYLKATQTPEKADAFLITVPTPLKNNMKKPDLSFIKSACDSIAPLLRSGNLIILESTSPVGTTEKIVKWLANKRKDLTFPHKQQLNSDINIAYCPERVLPGRTMIELIHNDRIIGGMTPRCSELATKLYKTFVKGHCNVTNTRLAEMTKLTENSFRDVNIAFANELSLLCDQLNINVWELIKLTNLHPRVNILQPGPGVGGHCIAIDPWFIISKTPKFARLIKTARNVNDSKPDWVLKKIKNRLNSYLSEFTDRAEKDVIVVFYGISFKPNVDDIRESPSVKIIEKFINEFSCKTFVVDPFILDLPDELKSRVELISFEKAIFVGDINILLVDHDYFKKTKPITTSIFDTRGIWV